jgi:hypothetical protein
MLNVKYYMYPQDIEKRNDYLHAQFTERNDLRLRYEDSEVRVYENPKFCKRAFIVSKFIKAGSAEKALELIFDDSFDPTTEAVIESNNDLSKYSVQVVAGKNPNTPTVEISGYLPNSLDIHVDMPNAGMLVLVDNYDDGWYAYVDGRKEKIYRVNYIMRGVPLMEGRHEIKFIYDPWYFKVGLGFSLIGISLFLWLLFKLNRAKTDK